MQMRMQMQMKIKMISLAAFALPRIALPTINSGNVDRKDTKRLKKKGGGNVNKKD